MNNIIMAKKSTNKTQHVMNLLSKSSVDETTTENNLQVNSKDEDPVANIVNDKLEELLISENEGQTTQPTDGTDETIEEVDTEFITPTQPEIAINEQLIASFESEQDNIETVNPEPAIIENVDIPVVNNITNFVQEDFDNENTTSPDDLSEEEYVCVNVAEQVVREVAAEIMARFNACTCIKCKNDLYALALNDLPPKYVATHKGQLFAKLNAYGVQNATDVLSTVTKACIRIKANPRH